jgi:hypothetical protein
MCAGRRLLSFVFVTPSPSWVNQHEHSSTASEKLHAGLPKGHDGTAFPI